MFCCRLAVSQYNFLFIHSIQAVKQFDFFFFFFFFIPFNAISCSSRPNATWDRPRSGARKREALSSPPLPCFTSSPWATLHNAVLAWSPCVPQPAVGQLRDGVRVHFRHRRRLTARGQRPRAYLQVLQAGQHAQPSRGQHRNRHLACRAPSKKRHHWVRVNDTQALTAAPHTHQPRTPSGKRQLGRKAWCDTRTGVHPSRLRGSRTRPGYLERDGLR